MKYNVIDRFDVSACSPRVQKCVNWGAYIPASNKVVFAPLLPDKGKSLPPVVVLPSTKSFIKKYVGGSNYDGVLDVAGALAEKDGADSVVLFSFAFLLAHKENRSDLEKLINTVVVPCGFHMPVKDFFPCRSEMEFLTYDHGKVKKNENL